MDYKAALFDMNGVIVDDEELHEAAFKQVLEARDFTFTHDDYITHFAGKTDEAGFISIYDAQGLSLPDLEVIGSEKAMAYQNLAAENLKPYPGIIDYIDALIMHGLRLALVTSSIRIEAETVLEVFDIHDAFEVVITANDITASKPDPQGYEMARERLMLEPQECFIIEDAPSGVQAAKAAGIACIAVTNTHSKEDLEGATKIVEAFNSEPVLP